MNDNDRFRVISNRIDSLERCRRRFLNEKLKDTGLKGHQFLMMLAVFHEPGITQEELSRLIDIDKTRIARSCILLEECGFLMRTRDTADRRKYHLALSEEGIRMVPAIRKAIAEWGEVITSGLSERRITKLAETLDIITNNAREYEGGRRI